MHYLYYILYIVQQYNLQKLLLLVPNLNRKHFLGKCSVNQSPFGKHFVNLMGVTLHQPGYFGSEQYGLLSFSPASHHGFSPFPSLHYVMPCFVYLDCMARTRNKPRNLSNSDRLGQGTASLLLGPFQGNRRCSAHQQSQSPAAPRDVWQKGDAMTALALPLSSSSVMLQELRGLKSF